MVHAKLAAIHYHVPEVVLGNEDLAKLYPGWTADKILQKTGIRERRIAAEHETAADLAFMAARELFSRNPSVRDGVDFVMFCTQTPDYFLPSSACILHQRLGLARSCGAVDINQGCSGFVYSVSLAKGLIESGQARNVLVLTADTYSKLIHPMDKSTRTIFGDAGAATLVSAIDSDQPKIFACIHGTDGSGADKLIVPTGAFREMRSAESATVITDASGNSRARDNLFMDGADVLAFTLREVPRAVNLLLERAGRNIDEIDYFVFHQGSRLMLDMLRKKLGIPVERFIIDLEEIGNTVSSTIPVTLARLRTRLPEAREQLAMLVGFGVGYSWAGTIATI
jgi:3-oxoacyl-[acyl-carrier-protein] synthase-3